MTKVDLMKNTIRINSFSNNYFTASHSGEFDFAKKYRKIKAGGIILTSVGTATVISGAILIKKDNDLAKVNQNRKDRSMNYGLGMGLLAVGVPGVLSGVPMWIIGNRKMKKALNNVDVCATPVSSGIVYYF
ncbi:MAG: hypothetical protein ACK5NK_04455 [Niabella sp.]